MLSGPAPTWVVRGGPGGVCPDRGSQGGPQYLCGESSCWHEPSPDSRGSGNVLYGSPPSEEVGGDLGKLRPDRGSRWWAPVPQ